MVSALRKWRVEESNNQFAVQNVYGSYPGVKNHWIIPDPPFPSSFSATLTPGPGVCLACGQRSTPHTTTKGRDHRNQFLFPPWRSLAWTWGSTSCLLFSLHPIPVSFWWPTCSLDFKCQHQTQRQLGPHFTVVEGQIIYMHVCVSACIAHVHVYVCWNMYVYRYACLCLHLYLYLCLYISKWFCFSVCTLTDQSWMGYFWDSFFQESLFPGLLLSKSIYPWHFPCLHLVIPPPWLEAITKSFMMNVMMINNHIQTQLPLTAFSYVKPNARIFSHIVLFHFPYNLMEARF